MTVRGCSATVKQLPELVSAKQGRIFWGELESCMNIDRPCIVLDCSKVCELGTSTINLLLCCLEEAMKRNGDVKLAAVPAKAVSMLELTGVNRLFEIFDTEAEAVNSFSRPPLDVAENVSMPVGSHRVSESAA